MVPKASNNLLKNLHVFLDLDASFNKENKETWKKGITKSLNWGDM